MHQNLLRLILSLIGRPEKQHVGWPHLEAYSQEAFDRYVALEILGEPTQRDYVVDPRYGPGPIPVIHVDGTYYLATTDPDGPGPVEIDERMLQEYHLETADFLTALAEQNEIEPIVEIRESGLWQVGRWLKYRAELLVLFAPARFSGDLDRAVSEAERLLPTPRTLLLVPFRTCLDGKALDLDERRVVTLVLEDALTPDLKLQLPPNLLHTLLEVDVAQRTAYWGGQVLDVGEGDFFVLEELGRRPGQIVSRRELCRARGQQRTEESVRKSIMRLRRALVEADRDIDDERSKRIIGNIRGVGYQLRLPAKDVRLLE